MGPSIEADTREPLYKHKILDDDGIAAVGELVKERQVSLTDRRVCREEENLWCFCRC